MAVLTLRLSRLLALSPSERLDVLGRAAREIDAQIECLRAGHVQVRPPRCREARYSRQHYMQSLYARRQQLIAMAREAGCEGWEPDTVPAA